MVSYYFFNLKTTLHSWLGIIIVLTTTYCYMNIALRMPTPSPPPAPPQEKAHLLEEAGGGTDAENDADADHAASPRATKPRN